MQAYENLEVYQEAHLFSVEVYKTVLKQLEAGEPLRNQLWRSVSSIPLNIVEGTAKKTQKDFASFLYNARGSARESEEIFNLCKDTGLMEERLCLDFKTKSIKIQKMLTALIKKIEDSPHV